MGTVLEFKTKEIEPAIDRATFLEMILNEQKRKEILKKFDDMDYDVEQFYVSPPRIFHDED